MIRALAAVKSLLTFGQRTGFLVLNVGAALKLPPPPRQDTLVQHAATRADIEARISPHWLRHAHATHALERVCFMLDTFTVDPGSRQSSPKASSCGMAW